MKTKFQNIKDFYTILLQWPTHILIRRLPEQELILICILRTNNWQKNYSSQLLENLQNVYSIFYIKKLYSSFKDNILCANLANMQLINK